MATTMYDDARGRPGEPKPRTTRRGLIVRLVAIAILLGVLGGGLYGFNEFRQNAIAEFFAGNVPPPTPVAARPAQAGEQPRYLTGIGSLVAIRQVQVSPEVEGRVSGILFEPGQTVTAGTPLVQLNDAPERADLANFRAQEQLAQANLARTERLVGRDFATQATLDQNRALLEQARAGIARTEAEIAQRLVSAPFDGELGIRAVEFGQQVTPGTTLVTLTDLERLYVNFTVPEQARAQVRVGQMVEFTVDAYAGRTFQAELLTIEPQIDPGTRTIRLQAKLDNEDRVLLPGMFASARVVLPPRPEVVTVPETAVTRTLYGDSVFIVREEPGAEGQPAQKAEQTFVRTGDIVAGRVAVLEGVRAGDLVVESGQLKLQNGAAVRVTADDSLAVPATPPVE